MRVKLFVLALMAALILPGCGKDMVGPSEPTGSGNPVVTYPPPEIRDSPSADLVQAPPPGSVLRVGQELEFTVRFHLPVAVYPTSLSLRLIYKNRLGGFTATSGCIQRRSQPQLVDGMTCKMRIYKHEFDWAFDPEYAGYGIAPGETIWVEFHVFNWDDERHPGDLTYRKGFDTRYVFQP